MSDLAAVGAVERAGERKGAATVVDVCQAASASAALPRHHLLGVVAEAMFEYADLPAALYARIRYL